MVKLRYSCVDLSIEGRKRIGAFVGALRWSTAWMIPDAGGRVLRCDGKSRRK
jgi:hypothetical protein